MSDFNRIFITGGASGLGKAIATYYAKRGFRVAIGDINESNLAQTKHELKEHCDDVIALVCDTTELQSVDSAKQVIESQWQGLDILVNNAGVAGTYGLIEHVSLEDWQRVIDVNLYGVVRGCQVFAPMFKAQGAGAVVNIASMAGLLNPPNASMYNASKAAVISLTEALQYELAPFNVSAHAVCPAFFKTNLTESMVAHPKAKEFVHKEMANSGITADDVARMIAHQVANKQLMLLTHPKERRLHRMKRLLPKVYEKVALSTFAKISKKLGKKTN